MGHDESKCTKPIVRKELRQKILHDPGEGVKPVGVTYGQKVKDFQPVRNPARRSLASSVAAPTQNTFEALGEAKSATERIFIQSDA